MATTSEKVAVVSDRRSTIGVKKTGLVIALVLGGMHLGWALLVAVGVAQVVSNFLFRLHFIQPVFVIHPFEPLRALGLVLLSAAIGYCIGVMIALIWNSLHR